MAQRVSIYRPQLRIPVLDAPRFESGQNARELTGAIGLGLEAHDRQQKEEAQTWTAMQVASARRQWSEKIQKAHDEGEVGDGFANQTEAEFQKYRQEALKGAPNAHAKRMVTLGLEGVQNDVFADAGRIEAKARMSRVVGQVEKTLNDWGNVLQRDPSQIDKAWEETGATVAGLSVPVEIKQKLENQRGSLALWAIQGAGRDDPSKALQLLNSGKYDKFNLDADRRNALVSFLDGRIQHQAAMADHAAVVAERNRKLAGDQIAKEGFDLLAKGQMTEEWMNENRRTLDTADYRMLRQGMQEGGGTDNAEALAKLYTDIYIDGIDTSQNIVAGMRRGAITAQTAKSLLDENKAVTPAKRARAFIAQYLKPSDLNPAPGAPQAFAEAMAEFDRFYAQDPKQDPMELARKVVQRNAVVQFDRMTVVKPLPKYAVGGRQDLDVKGTKAATYNAFLAKHNGDKAALAKDPEYLREARSIKEWEEALKQFKSATDTSKPGATK